MSPWIIRVRGAARCAARWLTEARDEGRANLNFTPTLTASLIRVGRGLWSGGVPLDVLLDGLTHQFAGLAVLAFGEFVELVAQRRRQSDLPLR